MIAELIDKYLYNLLIYWRSLRDSNPCYSLESARSHSRHVVTSASWDSRKQICNPLMVDTISVNIPDSGNREPFQEQSQRSLLGRHDHLGLDRLFVYTRILAFFNHLTGIRSLPHFLLDQG